MQICVAHHSGLCNPEHEVMTDEYIPDPDCPCVACWYARRKLAKKLAAAAAATPAPTPRQQSAQPVAPPPPAELPRPWTDAVEGAVALGMKRPRAVLIARQLAATYPNASEGEALRLLFGN
jgi:hypothetical protein